MIDMGSRKGKGRGGGTGGRLREGGEEGLSVKEQGKGNEMIK